MELAAKWDREGKSHNEFETMVANHLEWNYANRRREVGTDPEGHMVEDK